MDSSCTALVFFIALRALCLRGVFGGSLIVLAVGACFQGDLVSFEATEAQVFGPTLFLLAWIDFLLARISCFFSKTFCLISSTGWLVLTGVLTSLEEAGLAAAFVGVFVSWDGPGQAVDFFGVLTSFEGVVAVVDFLLRGIFGFGA